MEYYINDFDDVAAELVKMRGLTRYNRMVLFLEGLPVKIARKVYEEVKLDAKKLETFERLGVFNEVVEAALNHNRADANFDLIGTPCEARTANERDDVGDTQETGVEATHPSEHGSDTSYASATDKTKCRRGRDGGTGGGNAIPKDLYAAEMGGAGGSVTQPDCEESTFCCRRRADDGDEREYVFLVRE